jgi:hypothetical protein
VRIRFENIRSFLFIDRSLQCYNENADCEEASVKQIAAKRQETLEDQAPGEDDTAVDERVTNQDARKCIAGLLLCFMQEVMKELDTSSGFVQLQLIKRMRGDILDQFLQSRQLL